MDMSGGAAVLEAVARDRRARAAGQPDRRHPLDREHALRARDQARRHHHPVNGKTVEVNNTDAEGRLILADALAYAVELGAERLVDLATLTGAVLIALGSTYAALISNDDELAARGRGRRPSRPASSPGGCRCTPSTRS